MPYKDKEKQRLFMNKWGRIRYYLRRRVALVYLGEKCVLCGMIADQYSTCTYLEIDHRDRTKKHYTNSSNRGIGVLTHYNKKYFWKELKKCQLLCIECHKDKTKWESKYYEYQSRVPF